ncbi:pyridoxamine 5'-phosphate oxidase family protein [Rhodococcus opacus]|uniref:pyridoxamine 5'-phosphate oxidase family protein n=1 Tax=Rhodococcus opacus TaxID=37919 RepID=UPI0024B947AB|nr:pyridoxamine 5'-phosphate oxidase family protein [Rhodococcus opacus]MDJ0419830.1 pyridoxamine 5'-phosphate oxidase family protein [Rhodococcus opacus]
MDLLRSVPTGRLVYTKDALSAVRPVTFAAPGGEIVIPTGDNPWFDRFDGTVLAFEAGAIESSTRAGWTVLAIGHSRLQSGTDGLDGFNDPVRAPWDRVPGDRYLVIDIASLTGHRSTLLRPAGDRR